MSSMSGVRRAMITWDLLGEIIIQMILRKYPGRLEMAVSL
jgi:hypothetical protein